MNGIEYVIGGLLLLIGVFLIITIMLQESKKKGLGGAISGSSSDSFFGRNKGKTREQRMNKITTVLAVLFVVLVLTLYILHTVLTDKPGSDINEGEESSTEVIESQEESSEVEPEDSSDVEPENSEEEGSAEASEEVQEESEEESDG